MTRMTTRTHGILDLVTAGTLLALPRMLGWGDRLTSTLTKVAIGSLGYSLLTNYEFGAIRVLPMRGHLAIDAASGMTLCAAPAMFPEEDLSTHATLVALGLFEIGAAMLTNPEPFTAEDDLSVRSLGRSAGEAKEGLRSSLTSSML